MSGLFFFSGCFNSIIKYFVFNVLPFGLSSDPYIFTKLVRALVNRSGGLGLRVIKFLDGESQDFASC